MLKLHNTIKYFVISIILIGNGNDLLFFLGRRISSTRYHEPLQRIHSRSRLHKLDKTDGSSRKEKRKSRELREVNVLPKINEGQEHKGHYSDSDERPRSLTDFPLIKKRHHHHHRHHSRHHHEPKDVKDKKENKDANDLKDLREKSHHHHHRHHHHRHPPIPAVHQHRTISEREQLQSRLRSGALTLREIEPIQERLATETDEASQLAKRDLEEMACTL